MTAHWGEGLPAEGMQRAGAVAIAAKSRRLVRQTGPARNRWERALRRSENWFELVKFCVVGASGYLVNLAVYVALLRSAGLHYLPAAGCSFLAAATNNYGWNRLWTFRAQRGHVYFQGLRFLVVSLLSLGANLLALHGLVGLGAGKIFAQAVAIVLVTPLNFLGNKLWAFRRPLPTRAG